MTLVLVVCALRPARVGESCSKYEMWKIQSSLLHNDEPTAIEISAYNLTFSKP